MALDAAPPRQPPVWRRISWFTILAATVLVVLPVAATIILFMRVVRDAPLAVPLVTCGVLVMISATGAALLCVQRIQERRRRRQPASTSDSSGDDNDMESSVGLCATVDRLFVNAVHADDPAAAEECPVCMAPLNELALRVSPLQGGGVRVEIGRHHVCRCRTCRNALHTSCAVKILLAGEARCPCCRGAL
jgi:hypothetical protein